MGVVVHLPGDLQAFASGRSRVLLDPAPHTVAEALDRLWALHPGARDRVLTETGDVRLHVNLFVGPESIRSTGGLATALADGAEITIVPAVSGG